MTWETLDWEVLDRLRETFLARDKTAGPYWHTVTDLECYDFTYGERIGWKWDAVLQELKHRGWSPPPRATVLDWGCGSGIAGRRVVEFFGAGGFSGLLLHDHSSLALDFAEHHGRRAFPGLPVERATYRELNGDSPVGLLVVSHVVNELTDLARAELTSLCARAQAVLWVEPGTHEVSRRLGAWREQLRDRFHLIAPCPHQAACGILTTGNERHWCHFFAPPPAGVYADSGWVKFGQRAGIDLRALPYSFLVLERKNNSNPAGSALAPTSSAEVAASSDPTTLPDDLAAAATPSVLIGEARHYKGYAKLFNCDAAGVAELMLQKRDAPDLFKALKHGAGPSLRHWSHENGRITQITSAAASENE